MNRTGLGAILLAGLLVVGAAVPVLAVSAGDSEPAGNGATVASQPAQNDSGVNVTVGQQLSTVLDVSSDEVQTGVEDTAFDLALRNASEEERAEAIAARAATLRDRAQAIRTDFEAATEAYEAGEITKAEYARRLATLHARAANLLASYEQLRQRAADVSALDLRAAGLNRSALNRSIAGLRSVTGPGVTALFKQFTGTAEGEIELETENGLSIAVENSDGERAREFERPRDTDDGLTVSQATALETARNALTTPEAGTWVLTEAEVAADEGAYEFAFALRNAATLTGEAEVAVDGSTGKIFALEETLASRDSDDDDGEDDRELALVVTEGTPAPNATITVQVLADGEPVEGVTITLNDRVVGTTDADGTLSVTLPTTGEVELAAETDDAGAKLEFEFGDDGDDAAVLRKLNVTATLEDTTVTTSVLYDGDPVRNATVYANGERVGTTDSAGRVAFTIDPTAIEELDLEIVKGAFEAELTYAVGNDTLTPIEQDSDAGDDESDDSEDSTDTDDSDDDEEQTETPEDESDS